MSETAVPVDMDGVVERRDLVVEKVTSADGTSIAYERSGEGPPVVMLGGGLTQKAMFAPLARFLAENFTVYNYDRRGRGDSGDNGNGDTYTIDHEVADLEAVVRSIGEPCNVWANCTGGIIALRAAAQGVPMAKLAVYEPPYSAPDTPPDYLDRVKELVAADRSEDAVELFWREYVRFPDELIANFRFHPSWDTFVALAPTIVYDGVIGNDHAALPHRQLARTTVPVLVVDGGASPQWQREACETVAREVADGRHVRLEGQTHLFDQATLAPVLAEFFSA
ncbi:alpha/beta fold hydrolase [Amycolatopsis suaedae]|uniref:alpha/beta fold hydrolase n=1 Tax=Amycolatopsis suaedae TaxID=2510978 RepID=UPI001F0E59A0|nr:alpha/beta hydrolase [Amycolatopsis suaedae]